MELDENDIREYLEKHIPYRLNCMMAWEIIFSQHNDKDDNRLAPPSFEIAIVFGRQLLEFLGIKRKFDKQSRTYSLKNFNKKSTDNVDDVHISDLNPGKGPYPLELLKESDKNHLMNLIKVANKSAAHLTLDTSSNTELESLEPARKLIFKMVTRYVSGLRTDNLWYIS